MRPLKVFTFSLIFTLVIHADSIYNKIYREHKIVIGISKSYPPLNIINPEGRIGVEIKMIESLSEFMDVKIELLPLDVSEYVAAIQNGKVDMVIAGMSRSMERSKKIWFSRPYLTIHPAGLVDNRILRKTEFGEDIQSQPVTDLWELKKYNNVEFGIKTGSIYSDLVKNEFSGAAIVNFNNNEEGINLLYDFKINVLIHDSLYLEYLVRKNPALGKSFTLLKANQLDEYLCIGLPFGDSILKNQVDTWLDELIRTKKIKEWVEKFSNYEN